MEQVAVAKRSALPDIPIGRIPIKHRSFTMKNVLLASVLAAGLFAVTPAFAEVLEYNVTLNGASQSPPVDTKATGTADVKVDTDAKTITWTTKTSGLSGPATAAHFHGPAAAGANAAPEIDISKNIDSGSAPITDAQIADVKAGKVYLNVHTAKYPDGEIRGQLTK
jgi:CHRD domain